MRSRLLIHKSNKFIHAQLIDKTGKTLGSVKGKDPKKIGENIAKIAISFKQVEIIFDRGNHKYHGQVKTLAESARASGLKF